MRFTCLLLLIAACLITSCVPPPEYLSETAIHATVQAAVATAEAAMRTPSPTGTVTWTPSPSATPSSSPTATQTKVPSPTPTVTLTPTAAPTPTATRTSTATPTLTATQTRTPTLTLTPAPGRLNTAILGCTTGLDVIHGLGEVTNAYARVRNVGGAELTNVCLTLNANDEGKKHPDKTYCIPSLRPNYEVTTKLTVDTEYGKLTLIEVAATANQGTTDKVSRSDCRALSNSELNQLNPTLNVPKPIQGP